MMDIQLAIAKQRGLDLISEASAERAATRVARFRAARRKQAQRDEISCARAAGGRVRTT
jgi:hypothetical protein